MTEKWICIALIGVAAAISAAGAVNAWSTDARVQAVLVECIKHHAPHECVVLGKP